MKITPVTLIAALGLSGCATVFDGNQQDVALTSNAPDATCSISRNGAEIAAAQRLPATFYVPSRPGNLIVSCEAPGHRPAQVALVNGKHPMTVTGVMLVGVLANVGTDAISHSWHEAQNAAHIHLLPN